MTRDEHLAWAKKRALEYLDKGDIANAITSMGSDLEKHPELKPNIHLLMVGMLFIRDSDFAGARRWIEGFR